MSDNKLDQFFRNKLDQPGSVPFDPLHWEEAKLLLKEKKKDRTKTMDGASFRICNNF